MKLLKGIEKRCNRLLALDVDALARLAELSGQVILLELLNTGFMIYLVPSERGIQLFDRYHADANVRVRGTPSAMVIFLLKSGRRSTGFGGNIEIIGDVGLAQEFQSILKNLDLDWEEQLAHWFGDSIAHTLGRVLRGGVAFAGTAGGKLQQDISEYLRFEKELTVEKTELAEYCNAVDALRNDAERLKLRIKRLQQLTTNRAKP